MSILAALGGALSIGLADFLGGISARRSSALASALAMNLVALVIFAAAFIVLRPHLSGIRAIGAVAGGLVSSVAVSLIYAAFAAGAMSLAAPLIACGSALVPTVAAIVVGTTPGTMQGVGIAFALAGVLAITWSPRDPQTQVPLSRRALMLTTAASLAGGIAFSVLLLSVKGGDGQSALGVAGVARLTAACSALAMAAVFTRPGERSRPPLLPAFGAGAADCSGATLLLIAATLGNTAVTAVIVSLYAAVTVFLAQTVLRERIASRQAAGILAAAIGVVLLSVG